MSETKVVNLRKEKYDIYIGRSGKNNDGYFGNPFQIGRDGSRDEVIAKYKQYFYNRLATDEEFKVRIEKLKNCTLGCFCKPNGCHGDIIKEYLDKLDESKEKL